MRDYLTPLLFFQRFFLPGLLALVVWATWRTIWRKDLAIGLALYLGLVIIVDGFLNTGLFIPGFEKGSIRYSEVCAAFLLFRRPPASARRAPHAAVWFFVVLYFSLLLLSAFRSDSLVAGFFEFRRLIVPQVIAFLIATRGLPSPDGFRRFFFGMMALSIIVGLFVFFDLFFDLWLIRSDTLLSMNYGMSRSLGRFGGFFINPNYLGAFVVLTFPAAFVWTLSQEPRMKLFGVVGLLSLVFCLVETQSRGPLLAFGITILLLLVGPAGDVSRTRRLAVFLPFVAVLVLLMPGFFEHASRRFEEIDQEMTMDSARTRETIWLYTKRAIADHPLAGIGFGEVQFLKVINREYGFEDRYGETSLDNPHNSYLQMTVYAGFPALISFVIANILLLFSAARSILGHLAERQTHMVFGLAVGLTGFLAVIYPDMHMFTQTVAPVYWLLFGLLFSLTTRSNHPAATAKQGENHRAQFKDAGRGPDGQSASLPPQYRRDRYRAPIARVSRLAEDRAPLPDREARRGADGQHVAVQPAAAAFPVGAPSEHHRREVLPARVTGRGLAHSADRRPQGRGNR